jgi:2-succinyl-6-hydroxy-2,4-cyclohexadiene-1-carboxylate synthase
VIWALHGAFGDAEDWDGLRESIGRNRVQAVDLWGDDHDLPFRDWAGAFNQRVSEVDSAPVLLGYSMGARLGLHALIAEPGIWKGAVLVAPHPGLMDEESRLARREHDRKWITTFDDLPWSQFWREWTGQPLLESPETRPLPRDRRARRRGLDLWSLAQQADLRPELGRIECPVEWVTGQRDEKFTAIGNAAAPLISQVQQIVVPDAGHRVPWDTPQVFAQLVKSFVDRLETTRND